MMLKQLNIKKENSSALFCSGNSDSESVPQQDEVQINIHITLHLRRDTFTAQTILNFFRIGGPSNKEEPQEVDVVQFH